MDESWRIPIGSVFPRRRSTDQPRSRPGIELLDPDDFRDVFGGPPRTVLLRQFSGGDLTSPSSSSSSCASSTTSCFDRLHRYHHPRLSRRRSSFYEEVFRRQPPGTPRPREGKVGLRLPDFTLPSAAAGGGARRTEERGLYGDIFGWESERRSRTRSRAQSKSNSSSVLSSEDQDGGEPAGLLRPWLADDGVLISFASKLRPISIPSRRCDAPSPTPPKEQTSNRGSCTVPSRCPSLTELRFDEYGVAGPKAIQILRPYSPPESMVSVEPKSPAVASDDDSESGSSVVYDIPMATIRPVTWSHGKVVEEEEEAETCYMIEMVAGERKQAAETGVEEVIAWVKEKSGASSLGVQMEEVGGVGEDDQKKHSYSSYTDGLRTHQVCEEEQG